MIQYLNFFIKGHASLDRLLFQVRTYQAKQSWEGSAGFFVMERLKKYIFSYIYAITKHVSIVETVLSKPL